MKDSMSTESPKDLADGSHRSEIATLSPLRASNQMVTDVKSAILKVERSTAKELSTINFRVKRRSKDLRVSTPWISRPGSSMLLS